MKHILTLFQSKINQLTNKSNLSRVGGTASLLGQSFIHQSNMSKITINQAIDSLERKDYVFKDSDGLMQVLDPLIKTVLAIQK